MNAFRIGILEDDAIIAMSIVKDLAELGYQPLEACGDYEAALQLLRHNKPELMLVDVMLGAGKDGIEFAMAAKEQGVPVIFVTANSDAATLSRAKDASPAAYLIKPFDRNDLHASIEIAMNNFIGKTPVSEGAPYRIASAVFIKQGQYLRKVVYEDILYLESDNTYLYIHTADKKLVVRDSLSNYLGYLDSEIFCRIHRSYAINLHKLDALNGDHVLVNNQELPIGKQYRAELLKSMRIG